VIRFLVPLTASDAIVREGLGIVAESLRELTGSATRVAVNA
jgi:4-aminobutyrate aminotransferase-like enzyme